MGDWPRSRMFAGDLECDDVIQVGIEYFRVTRVVKVNSASVDVYGTPVDEDNFPIDDTEYVALLYVPNTYVATMLDI